MPEVLGVPPEEIPAAGVARPPPAWLQALPMGLVFLVFFVVPLVLTLVVSFWQYNEYEIIPAFTLNNYADIFNNCFGGGDSGDMCVTFKTYLSTLKFCVLVWLITLVLGFTVSYFIAFYVSSVGTQTLLFLLCTIRSGPRTSSG